MRALRALRADGDAHAHRAVEHRLREEEPVRRKPLVQRAVEVICRELHGRGVSFGGAKGQGEREPENGEAEDGRRDELEVGRGADERGEFLVERDALLIPG